MENLAQGSSSVIINGQEQHVISYLKKFLFTPEKTRSLVRTLSGGERNRLLLARILAQPADLLILDEPSNDLDIQSIEVLEQFLQDYQGTLLLVSHDRALLNRAVTSIWSFETAHKKLVAYAGNYDDYLIQSQQKTVATASKKNQPPVNQGKKPQVKRREISKLLKQIQRTEQQIETLHYHPIVSSKINSNYPL